ncbi:hypothetical protein AAG906_034623 [Vitis piasezkii]
MKTSSTVTRKSSFPTGKITHKRPNRPPHRAIMLFFSYFKDLVGREVTVELKNDLAIRGTLHSVDQYLNIKLENTRVVDQDKYPHMRAVVIWLSLGPKKRELYVLISSCLYMIGSLKEWRNSLRLQVKVVYRNDGDGMTWILTIDQLKKRGWTLVNGCFLYKDEEESANNLLLDCTKTRILWPSVFSLFGLERVMPASINGELLSWQGSFLGKRRKIVWLASIRNAIVIDLQEAREMKANNHHFGRYLEDLKMGKKFRILVPGRRSPKHRSVHEVFIKLLSVRNCFIRGSVVRYVQLPPEGVDIELLHDATRREARGG